MGFLTVVDYLVGIAVFGVMYWLLNGFIPDFQGLSLEGDIYDLANYLWTGAIIIYIVFGAIWLPRKINEFRGGLR